MSIAFAETVSDKYDNDIVYHVEWLDSEEAFPSLGSETKNNKTSNNSLQEWQILKKQDIFNEEEEEEDIVSIDGKKIKVSEMEDKWEEIQYEKQYVDIAEKAASLPLTNNAPLKPLRHQPKRKEEDKEERELRLLYWDQLDQMILEENSDFYDHIYYHRKTQGTRGNKGSVNHLRRRLEFLSLNNKAMRHLSMFNSQKVSDFLDTIPLTHGSTWGAPELNRRILHGLTRLSMPNYLNYYQQKHAFKEPKALNEVDFVIKQ